MLSLSVLAFLATGTAAVAVLAPNTFTDENGENPAACSLREAVRAINDGAAFGGCAAPTDTQISLGAGSYLITLNGCIRVSADVVITGAGAAATAIQGSGPSVGDLVCVEINDPATLTVRIEDLTFTGGAQNALETFGGGSDTIALTVEDVVFENNASPFAGAAVRIQGSEPTTARFERVVFRSNVVTTDSFGDGGAIDCSVDGVDDPVSLDFVDVHFADNRIDLAPGGDAPSGDGTAGLGAHLFSAGCQLTFNGVTFAGGQIDSGLDVQLGGALFLSSYFGVSTTATFENVTLVDNSAGTGGAIYTALTNGEPLALVLSNVTLSGNTATDAGDHLFFDGAASADAVNVLFGPGGGAAADCAGNPTVNLVSLGGNIDADGSCNLTDASDQPGVASPGLDPLADNGGFTPTQALPPGSAAIDRGVDPCPATDQRGEPRPIDGDGDGMAICDVGAYEAPGGPGMVPIQAIPAIGPLGLGALALALAALAFALLRRRRPA